jgi:two-component system sensor histidine kinase UhpB
METLLGLPAGQILGRNCCRLLHGTEHPIPDCPFVRMRDSGRRETLTQVRDGRTLQITVEPLRDEAGTLSGAVHLIADLSAQVRERTDLLHRIQELEGRRSACIPDVPADRPGPLPSKDREAESRRHYRLLSDEFGKLLAGLKLQIAFLQKKIADPSLFDPLQECLESIDHSAEQLQGLLYEIRPPLLDDLGLIPALRWEIGLRSARGGLPIHLRFDQPPAGLAPEIASTCFFLARGALARQSRWSRPLSVSIRMADDRLEMRVTVHAPDLQTVDPQESPGKDGAPTWEELLERVRSIGGEGVIQTVAGLGPEVLFKIPVAGRTPHIRRCTSPA